MSQKILAFIFSGLLLAAALPLAGSQEPGKDAIRRLALVIGANNGGPGREKLRYAVSDAKAMIRVLENLGGVAPDDSRLLVEPNRETLLWETGRLRERIVRLRPSQRRLEVFIYYSGHSDEDSILLGREKVSYKELRDQLHALAADVRIAILDSCASGAFIRAKGGQKRPAFIFDAAYDMKGFAIMTSSSADEVSQESDRFRGSFFTHYLISGLHGAADTSGDGRVTLSEAYQYAFAETLRQTEKTAGGAQHPSYNIQMSGTGDVVITDVRKSASILRLGRGVAGRIFIHGQGNVLVMEFLKAADMELALGLDKGRYRLIAVTDSDIREAEVELAAGESRELADEQFSRTEIIDAIARGDQAIKREGWKNTKKPLPFFIGFYGKLSRYEGHWSFMPGMQFGVALNRSLALGLSGFGKTAPESTSRPPFWGLNIDYTFLEKNRLSFRLRTITGFMYKSKEDELARKMSLVVEPGVGLAWELSRQLKIVSQLSLDFVNGTNDNLRRFSWGLGLEFCKQ
ncbi:MAG: caspase family protein [Candidatus Aminicenantes bacterium]|nr:caspase family protein [Candidatus Aminicenantes bacterium]